MNVTHIINKFKKPNTTRNSVKHNLIHYGVIAVLFTFITIITPNNLAESDFIYLSALPALFLLVYVVMTKRVFESLTLAILLAFLMGYKLDFFDEVNESLVGIMMDEDTVWLFIVCGLMGSIIALIEKSGGVYAFGRWVSKRAHTRKSTLLWTWILGVFIFIDDYLNSLTVGSTMAPLTDKHKVSREYLSYVVDSTAAPGTVILPLSTWAVFIITLYDSALREYSDSLSESFISMRFYH